MANTAPRAKIVSDFKCFCKLRNKFLPFHSLTTKLTMQVGVLHFTCWHLMCSAATAKVPENQRRMVTCTRSIGKKEAAVMDTII